MLLSCPAKKVTKECGIGEALLRSLSERKHLTNLSARLRAALPYVPLPA